MCTGIRLVADNGDVVYARTLEFGVPIDSNIIMIPRNYSFIGTTPSGKADGLPWQSRYAVIGANGLDIIGVFDGVNEKGLAGGLFYFPSYAAFQEITSSSTALAPWELMTWILTNFATVADVKKELPKITVANTVYTPWGIVPPIHAIVHDNTGKSLVIEYVKGTLQLYDNPLGVLTNSPTFDWHLNNLNNYSELSPFNKPATSLDGITLTPFGQGSGMLGMPGDFTPPSRFVRAAFYSQSVVDLKDAAITLDTAFHVLNLFDIPRGTVRQQEKNKIVYECTQWTSAADLSNKRYYWRTYDHQNVQMLDLMKMDLNTTKPTIINMSK